MANVFITGATTGIGAELAKQYAELGYQVGICGRNAEKYRMSPLSKIGGITFYRADVFDKESLHQAVRDFENSAGPIDFFYANAGVGVGAKSGSFHFDKEVMVANINVIGFLNSVSAIVPQFVERKSGHFISVSSLAGLLDMPRNAAYSASKSFVKTYTMALVNDVKKFGVHVTCILPGYVETPLTAKNDHKMPFMMPVEQAVQLIRKEVASKNIYYVFPWQTGSLARLMAKLPQKLKVWFLGKMDFYGR